MNPANRLTIDNSRNFDTLVVFLPAIADKTIKMKMGAIKIRTKIKPTKMYWIWKENSSKMPKRLR